MLTEIVTVVVLGIASGTAAFTISKTNVAQGFRKFVMRKSNWLGQLVACPNCLSHWLAAIAVIIYRPQVTDLWIGTDLGVSWLLTVFVAALTWGAFARQIRALIS